MTEITDQTGETVRLPKRPDRIVSTVPSQTELLSDLGLDDKIAGITKFCIHPEHIFRSKVRVGGTKSLNIEKIRSLSPELIIANKEENLKEEIEALKEICPVYISDIKTLEDSLVMIGDIGKMTGTEEKAAAMKRKIREDFSNLSGQCSSFRKLSVLYLIWKGPWMAAGSETFIDDLLHICGLSNVLAQERYPELNDHDIQELKPEVVLLSSEPYPFKEKHIDELKHLLPDSRIILADGEMFSWYGSRLLKAPAYLAKLLHSLHT